MRGRGLKLYSIVDCLETKHHVAPHAGAWIETMLPWGYLVPLWSLPMRGRGLKLEVFQVEKLSILVAPHAGAWIETSNR